MQTLSKSIQTLIDRNPAAVRRALNILLVNDQVAEVSFLDTTGQRQIIRRHPPIIGTIVELGPVIKPTRS